MESDFALSLYLIAFSDGELMSASSGNALDHDDFGSVRSEIINVIDSFWLERDAGGKPVPLFLIPL